MSQPEYVSMAIDEIDARIAETEEILRFLRAQRKAALEFATGSTITNWYYYVPSRTGGDGHYISRDAYEGKFTCLCPAGVAGRTCWAKKGILGSVDNTGQPNGVVRGFYDDNLDYYNYGASQKSLRRAKEAVDGR